MRPPFTFCVLFFIWFNFRQLCSQYTLAKNKSYFSHSCTVRPVYSLRSYFWEQYYFFTRPEIFYLGLYLAIGGRIGVCLQSSCDCKECLFCVDAASGCARPREKKSSIIGYFPLLNILNSNKCKYVRTMHLQDWSQIKYIFHAAATLLLPIAERAPLVLDKLKLVLVE